MPFLDITGRNSLDFLNPLTGKAVIYSEYAGTKNEILRIRSDHENTNTQKRPTNFDFGAALRTQAAVNVRAGSKNFLIMILSCSSILQ